MPNHFQNIKDLLEKHQFPKPLEISEIPSSGSDRIYFRLIFDGYNSMLAAFNPDVSENIAWFSFSHHFRSLGFRVPEIFARDESYCYFLLQDLGKTDLFSLAEKGIDNTTTNYYKMVLKDLLDFQVKGIRGLDLDVAYPVASFNKESILWDLNYFKYYFIKPNNLEFNENKLEKDFQSFVDKLLEADRDFFMYRDFQSRNILIHQSKPWYIDFQGGRKGPLQYDVVSLLYQAKARLTEDFQEEMLHHYLDNLDKLIPGSTDHFLHHYPYFIYFRLMQVFGAYGFRGLIQRKGHFLASIPFAIASLEKQMKNGLIGKSYPELNRVFSQIIQSHYYPQNIPETGRLTLTINSFSYLKKGIPVDLSGNGGGFVFDCRGLPNPGRIPELKDFTGRDSPIIQYLKDKKEVASFFDGVRSLIEPSIDNYLDRGFEHLQVNFGCTGGRHRSVYLAELLKKHLGKYGSKLNIQLKHTQLDDQ